MSSYSNLRTSLFFGLGLTLVGAIAAACGSSDSTNPLFTGNSDASTSDADIHDATTSDPDTGLPDAQDDASSVEDASADAAENDAAEQKDASTQDASTDDAGGDASTCSDKKKDGTETGIDCGGSDCPKCGAGQGCTKSSDCASGTCVALFCL